MLLIPAQLMAAASPFAYAWLNKTLGIAGAMWVSTALTLVIAGLAIAIVRSADPARNNEMYPTVSERHADKPVQNAVPRKHPGYIKMVFCVCHCLKPNLKPIEERLR